MVDNNNKTNQALNVLVVEDNQIFRELLCEVITMVQPYWHIYEATNGAEGLELAQRMRPDLIFLDFHMPVMNGYQMALALQQFPETAQIPLILSTSEDYRHPQIIHLRTFCQAALFKPFSLEELERVLEQISPVQTFLDLKFHDMRDVAQVEFA
jgi:two-component system chemotaxis response regulator CheB